MPCNPKFVDVAPLSPYQTMSPSLKTLNFATAALLLENEALRTITERTKRVLEFYNPETCRWKVGKLKQWFNEYFVPALRNYQNSKEKIFFPFYKKLGAQNFDYQVSDHHAWIQGLDEVIQCLDLLDGDQARLKYIIFSDKVFQSLDKAEVYWLPVMYRYGEDNVSKITKQILSEGLKRADDISKMMLVEICVAMGCNLNGPHPDEGWGDLKAKGMLKAQLSGSLAYSKWESNRAYYISLLISVAEDQERLLFKQSSGCHGCTVM